eukprot:9485311-Pyramimonas_sp.AAC.1
MDVPALPQLAAKGTDNQGLKRLLQGGVAGLVPAMQTPADGAAEALKRVVGAWRDADHKRAQAAANVARLHANPDLAIQ